MNINDLVGKRVLLKLGTTYRQQVTEFKVIEVSPSGNWVKLMNLNGNKFWEALKDIAFVEQLQDLSKDRPE